MNRNKILAMCFFAVLISGISGYTAAGQEKESQEAAVMKIGSDRQLFIDDLFFASAKNVHLQMNPAQKTGEENVVRDKPWESATLNWCNVMDDDGKYRMWYECYDIDGWPTADDTSFCYAESKDGIHWTKPELGLFEYQGSKQNNILFRQIGEGDYRSRVHGVCVFKDPTAPPDQRYKGVSQGNFTREPGIQTSWGGMMYNKIAGMYSPDGIHWTRYPKSIICEFADSQDSGFWDDQLKKYVVYGRVCSLGRVVGRSESSDFKEFKPLEPVLQANEKDPADSDLYNPAALKYPFAPNIYFLFPSLFQHGPQTLDIRLAVSRDGIHWTYPQQEKAFIPLGKKGEFDCGSLYMGHGILRVGNEIWQYYGGARVNHAEGELENIRQPGNSRVLSRVISRLDGFVSVEAGSEAGEFITPPLEFQGNILQLNVKVREGGEVRVALLDENNQPIERRTLEDCLPIKGDNVNLTVMWKTDGDVSKRAGMPTRLQFQIKNASLYAFQFAKGYPYVVK